MWMKISSIITNSYIYNAFQAGISIGESKFKNDSAEISAQGLMGIVLVGVMAAFTLPIAINAFTNTTYDDPMFDSMKIIIPLALFGGVAIGFTKGWL